MVKYYKPVAKLIERNLLDDAKERKIIAKAFVKSCIMDWEGVEIEGELKLFDFDLAVELLSGLPELLDTLMEYSQAAENYREEVGN